MKHIISISNTLLITLALSSCASSETEVAPSQNSVLNSISKSNTKEDGMMQKSLNEWIQNDWEPTVTKDKEIQEKYMQEESVPKNNKSISKNKREKQIKEEHHYVEKKDKNFTLQEYVDKAAVYIKAHPGDYNNSNIKKVESLPVIGK